MVVAILALGSLIKAEWIISKNSKVSEYSLANFFSFISSTRKRFVSDLCHLPSNNAECSSELECDPKQCQWRSTSCFGRDFKMNVIRWWNLIRCCFPAAAVPVVKGAYCDIVLASPVSICHAALSVFINKPDLFPYRNTDFASIWHNQSSIIVVN